MNSRKLSLMDKAQRYYRVVIGQGVDFLHATTLTPEEMKSATPRGAEIIELVPLEAALAQQAHCNEPQFCKECGPAWIAQQAQPESKGAKILEDRDQCWCVGEMREKHFRGWCPIHG